MDYTKFSEDTLRKMAKGEPLDYSKLTDDELSEMAKESDVVTADPEISKTESFLRGAAQGASFGFSDEITGALESAFTDKTYSQARDESRTANELAEQANPLTYLGGNLVGGAAVPLPGGAIASGAKGLTGAAKLARLAKVGAAAGALSAAGASDVDAVKAVEEQDTERLGQLVSETAQGGVAGAVITPFLGGAVPAAGGAAKDWWKSMRFGRDISDIVGYSMQNPRFMSAENFSKVSDDLRQQVQKEVLPMVTTDAQKAATSAYDAAKEYAQGKVKVSDLVADIKSAFTHANPAVNSDPAFKQTQLRATAMLAQLADVGPSSVTGGRPALDASDVYRLREEVQNMIEMANPDKINGNRDTFNSLLKLKDSIDNQLKAIGVPVDELSSKYSAVSELVGQTGVDLRNVDISKMPLRQREGAEKLQRILVSAKKHPESNEAARLNAIEDILKTSGLASPEKAEQVMSKANDLARQEYLLRSAMDESYLATDPKGYATGFGALTARGKALQGAGVIAGVTGAVKQGGSKAVAAIGNAMYKATPEELIVLASKVKDTKTAAMLRNIANQPEKKRKALLFAMMQNPGYREAVGAAEE